MTEYLFTNNAVGYLNNSIGGGDTLLTLQSGQGALFPSPGSGQGFYILVKEGATSEWMLCTSRSGDQLTVTRGGSNSFGAGASVKLVLNETVLIQFLQKGVFRAVTSDPDGSLSANYSGEEVLNTNTNHWWKHITGRTWKQMTT